MSAKKPDPSRSRQRTLAAPPHIANIGITNGARRRTFMDDIRIDYGPNDILSRLFIAADALLHEHGLVLSFASFEELVAVNHANRNSWLPLNPTFDPKNGNVTADCAFALLGRNSSGRVVTAQAMRIFDWHQTDFKREAESLRLLYADPLPRPDGAGCHVTAPSAHLIAGLVGYGGAVWLHPSVRGRRVVSSISRIGRAYAYTRWHIDLAIGLTSTALLATGFIQDAGFMHAEAGVTFSNLAEVPPNAALFWITSKEMIDDFALFADKSSRPSRGGLQLGNAQ